MEVGCMTNTTAAKINILWLQEYEYHSDFYKLSSENVITFLIKNEVDVLDDFTRINGQ